MTHQQEQRSDDNLADDKLEGLLRKLGDTIAKESQLSGTQRAQLIDSIIYAATEKPSVTPRRRSAGMFERAAFAVASCVILVLALAHWQSLWKVDDVADDVAVLPVKQSFAEKYHSLMQVAFEHEAILGRPLAWFAESGNDVQFTLLPEVLGHSSRVVFAELTLEKLHGKASETYFLMLRDTQPLELFCKEDSTLKLLFWLHPVEENLFAYELAVNHASTSGLIVPETTIQPFDAEENQSAYRVFIRVHPI